MISFIIKIINMGRKKNKNQQDNDIADSEITNVSEITTSTSEKIEENKNENFLEKPDFDEEDSKNEKILSSTNIDKHKYSELSN